MTRRTPIARIPVGKDERGGTITTQTKHPITASLIVRRTEPRVGRLHVYLYSVQVDGELIVQDSPEPHFDLARALLARGITGSVKIIDAATGAHRTTIPDIAAAALVTVREDNRHGLHFCPWFPFEDARSRTNASSLKAGRRFRVSDSPDLRGASP